MKVHSLTIKNFRGIRDLTLKLESSGATVVAGVNGAGKSSILDCLAIVLAPFNQFMTGELRLYPPQLPGDTGHSFSASEPFDSSRRTEIENTASVSPTDITGGNNECEISSRITLLNSEIELGVRSTREGLSKLSSELNISALLASVRRIKADLRQDLSASVPVVVYYSDNRYVSGLGGLWDQAGHEFDQTAAYERALTSSPVSFEDFFTWFRFREDVENERRIKESSYRDPQMQAVRGAIEQMVPGVSEPRVMRNPPRMVVTKSREEGEEGIELQVTQLSEGEKCTAAMVGDLARRLAIANPGLEDPLKGDGVVLIDEVDLHLHPKWQRMIIPALIRTFPNCQFVLATHSPQVISELKTKSLYLLRDTTEGIKADGPLSCFGQDSNRILEELMGVSERPRDVQEKLRDYFRLIDEGKNREAAALRQKLEQQIGTDDPDFVGADVFLRGQEILGP